MNVMKNVSIYHIKQFGMMSWYSVEIPHFLAVCSRNTWRVIDYVLSITRTVFITIPRITKMKVILYLMILSFCYLFMVDTVCSMGIRITGNLAKPC